MSPPTIPKIIIVGAGISGLALGQFLHAANIPFHIYERDESLSIRLQGYRVRMNSSGRQALSALLPPHIFSIFKECCGIVKPVKKGDEPYVHMNALTGEREKCFPLPVENIEPLCVDRSVIRMVLIKGIEEFVSFGKEFDRFEVLSEEKGVMVHFSDKSSEAGSLLIGADGVSSGVRKQVLPASQNQYIDTGGRWFFGKTPITPELEASFNELPLHSYSMIQDNTSPTGLPLTLLLEPVRFRETYRKELPLPPDYIFWVLGGNADLFGAKENQLVKLSSRQVATETQNLTKKWHSSFLPLFNLQDVEKPSYLRVSSQNPTIPVWETRKEVTLLGDAIHGMSPTAGVGSVTALRSTALLAEVLKEGWGNEDKLVKGLKRYEDEMRVFAGEAIKASFLGGNYIFGLRKFEELGTRDEKGAEGDEI